MIGYLRGRIRERQTETVLLEVEGSGIGYEVACSTSTLAELQEDLVTELWIHTHVREDALTLFGFLSSEEKNFFLSLLKVNGVGPKMALTILSGASPDQIRHMIEAEDVKALSALPKVGKKTAEQLILTLKGKLVKLERDPRKAKPESKEPSLQRELSSALVNLGFRPQDVEKVVSQIPEELDLEEGLRRGLTALTTI